jgi:hypothetical protein
MTYEARDGVSLGAVEKFSPQHQVSADTDLALARLSTVLEWKSYEYLATQTVRIATETEQDFYSRLQSDLSILNYLTCRVRS